MTSDKSEILDDTIIPNKKRVNKNTFSVLATINCCLSIMLGTSLLLIIYNKISGNAYPEVSFLYIYFIFGFLCISGFVFTVLSFVRRESFITLKWITGIVNLLLFVAALLVIFEVFLEWLNPTINHISILNRYKSRETSFRIT